MNINKRNSRLKFGTIKRPRPDILTVSPYLDVFFYELRPHKSFGKSEMPRFGIKRKQRYAASSESEFRSYHESFKKG